MKYLKITALLGAAISFAFTSCNKAPDEKTAIANFKSEIESVGKWIEEQKPAANDPFGAEASNQIIARLKAIKTDGLPEDLKSAWAEMNAVFTEMGEFFKSMPKIDVSKPEEINKAKAELGPKMMAIQAKVEPVAKKLEEVGKKHGIDMSKVAPGK